MFVGILSAPASTLVSTMGQVRGPCKVRAKGCKGVAASENAEHPTWKWRNAKNAGEIKAGDKDYGGAETACVGRRD